MLLLMKEIYNFLTIILVFFFISIVEDVFAKEINCTGFCKGETYTIAPPQVMKDKWVIGKRKYKIWAVNNGFGIKDSRCLPYFQTNTYGRKNKKILSDIDNLYTSRFEMNACGPCGLLFENQKGFCPIPLYSLDVIYQNAVNNDFPPKEYRDNAWWWHNEKTCVGRNYKSESPQIKKYMQDILLEKTTLTINPKKQISLFKFKQEETEVIFYTVETYKTPFKEQMIKNTDLEQLTDDDAINIINNFIIKIQQNMAEIYGEGKKENFLNTKLFYDSIPTDTEIDILTQSFPELKEFHFQLRN